MSTSLPALKALVAQLDPVPGDQSARFKARHVRIRTIAAGLFAQCGPQNISFTALAKALGMHTATLRQHFASIEALVADLLTEHFQDIAAACAEIPASTPNRPQKLRATYLARTRTLAGRLVSTHLIFTRDLPMLPASLRAPITRLHQNLGATMAGQHGPQALTLLDAPPLCAEKIEAALAAIAQASSVALFREAA